MISVWCCTSLRNVFGDLAICRAAVHTLEVRLIKGCREICEKLAWMLSIFCSAICARQPSSDRIRPCICCPDLNHPRAWVNEEQTSLCQEFQVVLPCGSNHNTRLTQRRMLHTELRSALTIEVVGHPGGQEAAVHLGPPVAGAAARRVGGQPQLHGAANKQPSSQTLKLRMLIAEVRTQFCDVDDQMTGILTLQPHRSKRGNNSNEPIWSRAHLDVGHGVGEAGCPAERKDNGVVVVCQQTLRGTAGEVLSKGYIA